MKGFKKIELNPGQEKTVTISICIDDLKYFDDKKHEWVIESGEFNVMVGASSRDIRCSKKFELID